MEFEIKEGNYDEDNIYEYIIVHIWMHSLRYNIIYTEMQINISQVSFVIGSPNIFSYKIVIELSYILSFEKRKISALINWFLQHKAIF